VYDGSNFALLSPANYSLTGFVGSDNAVVTKSVGNYSDANVGTSKLVTVSLSKSDFSAVGTTNLANYVLPSSVSGMTGVISPRPVTISSVATQSVYNGYSTYDSLSSAARTTIIGLVGSDSIANVKQTASLKGIAQAGSFAVTPSDAVFQSGLSTNYSLTYVPSTHFVDKASLVVTAKSFDKTYDGNAYVGGNGVSYRGFVANELSLVLSGTLAYAGTSQGAVNAGSYAITPTGLSSNNYQINYQSGSLNIGKASLQVMANNSSKPFMGPESDLTYTVSGIVAADKTKQVLSGKLLRAPGNAVGLYTISQGSLIAGVNYALNFTSGAFEIVPGVLSGPSSVFPFEAKASGNATLVKISPTQRLPTLTLNPNSSAADRNTVSPPLRLWTEEGLTDNTCQLQRAKGLICQQMSINGLRDE
jgi:hypothetical protein